MFVRVYVRIADLNGKTNLRLVVRIRIYYRLPFQLCSKYFFQIMNIEVDWIIRYWTRLRRTIFIKIRWDRAISWNSKRNLLLGSRTIQKSNLSTYDDEIFFSSFFNTLLSHNWKNWKCQNLKEKMANEKYWMERGRSMINSDSSGQTYILSFQSDIGFCSYFPRIQLLNKIRIIKLGVKTKIFIATTY